MPHGITARDVPEVRQDVADWFASEQARSVFARMIASKGTVGLKDIAEVADHLKRRGSSVRLAELYYVNDDMTDLAMQVAEGLEEWFLTEDVPDADHGFVVWAKPLQLPVPEELWPIAAAWSRDGDSVEVDTYGSAEAMRTGDRGRVLRAKGYGTYLDPMNAGKLIYQCTETLRVGEKPEGIPALLLATWLLIRQPSEERNAVHETSMTQAPRAAQKRIQRAGGDPTREVRYLTLRRSLRHSGDEGVGSEERARRAYRHRWFVKPHKARQYYPSKGEHQTIWRGPYLVVPAGCEDAPIIGGERVNVLRR
ncbi:hypothetical protein [Streptomyces sp. NPDC048611]|uniref:hypothetical protein n=1 Tax=Streptomyces sp. NPDC048611 TaxID=3155635 RepID=UPI0034447520